MLASTRSRTGWYPAAIAAASRAGTPLPGRAPTTSSHTATIPSYTAALSTSMTISTAAPRITTRTSARRGATAATVTARGRGSDSTPVATTVCKGPMGKEFSAAKSSMPPSVVAAAPSTSHSTRRRSSPAVTSKSTHVPAHIAVPAAIAAPTCTGSTPATAATAHPVPVTTTAASTHRSSRDGGRLSTTRRAASGTVTVAARTVRTEASPGAPAASTSGAASRAAADPARNRPAAIPGRRAVTARQDPARKTPTITDQITHWSEAEGGVTQREASATAPRSASPVHSAARDVPTSSVAWRRTVMAPTPASLRPALAPGPESPLRPGRSPRAW